jgi:heme/copper-type cytochrome/quinol oxidase subunit 2
VGLSVGLGVTDSHSTQPKGKHMTEAIENIALLVFLMLIGVGLTVAVLIAVGYYIEVLCE